MNPQVSQDFERLSAYIDNQLSPAEKAALEARLAQEPQLRAGLADLRRTVQALRNLPMVKPPRSFTLKPEQAGVRARRGPLFSTLRLAAALCTLLLVVTVARDLATNGSLSASVANHATTAGSAATPLVLPQAAVRQSPTAAVSSQSYGVSAPEITGTPAADMVTTPMVRMNTVIPSATPGPTLKGVGPSETPAVNTSVGAGGTGPSGAVVAASSTPAENSTAEVSSSPVETAVSVAALPPAATTMPALAPAAQPPEAAALNTLRLVEIVLAVLALVLAGATWLTRRG